MLYWLSILFALTLFPFEFQPASPALERLTSGLWLTTPPPTSEVVLNVLLFVPFGALLFSRWPRQHGGWRLVTIVCGAGLLMSAVVEGLQVFLPRRDPSLVDLLANTAGAGCGALVSWRWGPDAAPHLARWRAHAPTTVLVGLLTTFAILTLLMAGSLQRQARLSNWNASFPLQLGNERTGDRPWKGRVFAFELTDAATSAASIRRFAAGESPGLPGVPIARFELDGHAPYRDGAGQVPDLNWTDEPIGGDTATPPLRGRPWLQTDGPAPMIAQRVARSNAFSLRIRCATDDTNQVGPARIVSNSVDFNQRNLTIGQQGRALIVRIRTPHTGANGSKPEIVIPNVFSDLEPRDILISYDGATVLAAVAASHRVDQFPLSLGPMVARRITSLEIEADEHRTLDRMFIAFLFIVPATVVGVLREARRDRVIASGVWVVLFAAMFESTLVLASGRAFSWSNVALTVSIGTMVMAPMLAASSNRR